MILHKCSRWHGGDRRLWPLDGSREAFAYADNPEAHVCACGSGAISHVRFDGNTWPITVLGFLCAECAVNLRRDWRNERLRRGRACDERECVCGRPFRPTRADSRYCSAACRQRAYRLRGVAGLVVAADSTGGAV
jgi:hypothetical protein